MRLAITLLFSLTLVNLCFSQDDKTIKKADKLFDDKNYYQALKSYEEALAQNKNNAYVNFRIARCYIETNQKGKALQYAFDAVKLSEKPTSEMQFTLGQAYHINHQFDKAIEAYQKSDASRTNQKAITKLVQECNNGKRYVSDPTDAKVTNAGPLVNTEFHEYLPYITADRSKLFFTSRRPGSTGGKTDVDGQLFEDIYVADNKGGAWDKPVNIGSPLNSDIHDACVGISEDGQIMFVYKGTNGGDIYTSELKGRNWSKPEALSLNTEFFESSASMSPDEKTLYFVRKVENGSRDIFMCSRTLGGTWSKPKKLDVINTPYDEDAPFMHADGKTLYFSSKGHTSMGGYDVFKSVKNGGTWTTPVNLGSPINTAGNDVYFVLSADGKIGFYASEKEGGFGKQDIYSIRMPLEGGPALALLKGTVKDQKTGKATEADITITDNETKETIAQYKSNSVSGEYLITLPSGKNYGVTIEKEGHLFYSENVFLSDKEGYKEVVKEVVLSDAKPGAKVVLKNIFFTTGKFEIRPESSLELQRLIKLMKTNGALKIEISGHTDNIGDAKTNQTLSEQRAKAVMDYLIANGVDKSRLVAKGYGSTVPIDKNDTESGRQQNRRTEFKIIQ